MNPAILLDNLRSVHNVGSIFRTANAVGIQKIYLCGTTPTPLNVYGQKRKDFSKVALGADDSIEWEYFESSLGCVKKLKEENYYIIAVEQAKGSTDYKEVVIPQSSNPLFVIGNEVDGISKEILELGDVIAEIPMAGTKESLNVTIALGVAVYRILDL